MEDITSTTQVASNEDRKVSHFTLADFKLNNDKMVSVNDSVYAQYGVRRPYTGPAEYTLDHIQHIINFGDPMAKRDLSRNYFFKNTIYMRLVNHYANLLTNRWFLEPVALNGRSMKDRILNGKYMDALSFLDKMGIKKWGYKFSLAVIRDGCYYGLITSETKDSINIIDLPAQYCRNRYTDLQGNDIAEFDLRYFYSIPDEKERIRTIQQYPSDLQEAYLLYVSGKRTDPWIDIYSERGICFPCFGNQPLLLATIPAILNYEDYTELEKERDMEEIKKIIIQQIPHLTSTGELLFEPEEALAMHEATVRMMKNNKNHSVLTTYADIEVTGAQSVNETVSKNNLEKILAGVYERVGVSPQIFAATGNLSMDYSLKNDLSLMMIFVAMYNSFFTSLVNRKFGTNDISFNFTILPICYYNEKEYHERVMKMTLSGYSLLLPWIALGLSQRTLVSVKDLENDVLDLTEKLIPPMNSNSMNTGEEGGRPTKTTTEKNPRTIKNEESKDTGGQ